MYIGNGKISEKGKAKIFRFAKENKIKGLQRSYDYHTSLFTALFISLLLFFFNTIKETMILPREPNLIINWFILTVISVLFIIVADRRDDSFFAIKIREEGYTNSKKKAFKLIDSYSDRKK